MIQDILDPRSYDHKQIKLSSNDRTYHYVDVPPSNQTAKDVPVVLLLHGFPDLWYGWRYQIQGLANAGFRVIVPSQMGYATTEKPTEISAYSYRSCAADQVALMDAIGVQGKFHVVGHDWGGMLAWRIGNYFPQRVRAMVVICTPYAPITQPRYPYVPLENLVKTVLPNFGYQLWFGSDEAYRIFDQHPDLLLGPSHSRMLQNRSSQKRRAGLTEAERRKRSQWATEGQLRNKMLETIAQREAGLEVPATAGNDDIELKTYLDYYKAGGFLGPTNWYRTREVNWKEERESGLPKEFPTQIPVLFLPATEDAALPLALSNGMQKYFPGHNLKVVPLNGADHWVMADEGFRDQVNEMIQTHLLQHSGTARL